MHLMTLQRAAKAVFLLAILTTTCFSPAPAYSQGCCTVPSGPATPFREQSAGLLPGEFILSYQWNYSNADHIYDGSTRQRAAERSGPGVRSIQNQHTIGLEVGVVEHVSFLLEVPLFYTSRSLNPAPLSGGRLDGRLTQQAAGLGDIRALGRYWATTDPNGLNLAVEAGVKAPTGDDDDSDFYQGERLFYDVSAQTGTGSWDFLFGAAGFYRMGRVTPFASVRYVMTPQETTGTTALHPQLADPNTTVENSIPDQLTWTLGASYDLGSLVREDLGDGTSSTFDGLSVSLALDGRHVLEHDLIGGEDGFRRSFDALFVTPGAEWWLTPNVGINATAPITLARHLTGAPGTFPDVQFTVGMAVRF